MLEFELPQAFFLLPAPLLIFLLLPDYRDRSEALRAPFFLRMVELTGRNPSTGAVVVSKNVYQRSAVLLIWILVVTALARPMWAEEPIVRETAARDLLLIVDLSGSMEAKDFSNVSGEQISRIDAVKQVLEEFIRRREDDRLGLAVFGTAAFPQAPFTTDRKVVSQLLEELQPRMAGPQTMLGDAIGLAVRLFEASEMERKVAVLLTDGNDTGSKMPVARAAEIAAEEGVRIYTIAMGDPTTVGEDELNIPALEEIAALTGGEFFLALNRDELDGIYAELDRLEPAEVERISYRPKNGLFQYPLALALLIELLLATLMLLRRSRQVRHA